MAEVLWGSNRRVWSRGDKVHGNRGCGYAESIRTSSITMRDTVLLAAIVALGIASRVVHLGIALWDKYLGDALYAAMVYEILRLLWRPKALALWAAAAMVAIELFQLTGIAARMSGSEHLAVRVVARLMGTQFSLGDLAAYGAGISCLYVIDRRR